MINSYTDDCPLYLTGVADKQLREGLARRIRARGLPVTTQQIQILLYLFEQDGLSQKRLSEVTRMNKVSLAKVLNRMEVSDLTRRVHDSDDQRNKNVFLTATGKAMRDDIHDTIDRHRESAFQGISADEAKAFKVTLNKLLKNTQE
jgi:DNA-binding MarR family transcriptional regulator